MHIFLKSAIVLMALSVVLMIPQGCSVTNESKLAVTDLTTGADFDFAGFFGEGADDDDKDGIERIGAIADDITPGGGDPLPSDDTDDTDDIDPALFTLPELPGDVYSFAAELDGVVYSLPAPYAVFAQNGWLIRNIDLRTIVIEAGKVELVEMINGENIIHMGLINNTGDEIALIDCEVGSFVYSESHARSGTRFTLPGGVKLGSGYDEIVGRYGVESIQTDYVWALIIQYKEQNSWLEFEIDTDTNQAVSIMYANFSRREKLPEYTGAPPAVLGAYIPPDSLGDEWQSMECIFSGAIYRLPMPAEALINNGWTFITDENTMLGPDETADSVELRKDNQVLLTLVTNPTGTAQPLKHCFVLELSYDRHGARVGLELPGGVSEASAIDEVFDKFGEPGQTDDSATMFIYYTYGDDDRGVKITWSIESERIERLAVYNHVISFANDDM